MCEFFSAISNGKGKVLFLTLRDIQKIEKAGNPEKYGDWNSHTTIAHYNGIRGKLEDKWNKWEYNCETKSLVADGGLVTTDDHKIVKRKIEEYLTKNNAIYCQNIYKQNSGYGNTGKNNSGIKNSGNWNSGKYNSGDHNTGIQNSGDHNSGDHNSGENNAGYRNSGYMNTGECNAGDLNLGYWNTGKKNAGNCNTGDSNVGCRNSGDCNAGDYNVGSWNTGNWNAGFFNTGTPLIRMFGKETSVSWENIHFPRWLYFNLSEWVSAFDMTDKEKREHPKYETTDGFLRTVSYLEAWKLAFQKASVEEIKDTLQLPNFDYAIFEKITGITKKMIDEKLGGDKTCK